MSHILIVEDERHIAEGVRFNLEADGHTVTIADTGESALEILRGGACDLVVLDIMLPGISGFEVAVELRRTRNFTPILMLTARGRPEDVLRGFEVGADDYLPKPFELAILLARANGLLRRQRWMQQAAPADQPVDVFTFAGKTIDFVALELRAGERVEPLTLMEANLLRFLIQHQGKPVARKTMLEQVWGVREDTDTRAIDNFIVRLRRYIEDSPSQPKHLQTVRGVGYRFVPDP